MRRISRLAKAMASKTLGAALVPLSEFKSSAQGWVHISPTYAPTLLLSGPQATWREARPALTSACRAVDTAASLWEAEAFVVAGELHGCHPSLSPCRLTMSSAAVISCFCRQRLIVTITSKAQSDS